MKILISLALFLSFNVFATTPAVVVPADVSGTVIEGINFPPVYAVGEHILHLNGVGVRKATFLKVRVYAAGLYIMATTNNAQDFLTTSEPKYINMNFLRSVKKSDLTGTWDERFKSNLTSEVFESLKSERAQLNQWMEDLSKGDTMNFTFMSDSVQVEVKGQMKGEIQGQAFSQALLSAWFVNPIDDGLTNGLLGK